jgi:hypothetical protein
VADWVTVEVNLDPILEPVQPIINSIDSVLSFLITILNIVQTILNVLKVFLVGLLDPLRTIVELIIEEIRDLIRDLRQLGLYLTGDWELIRSEDKFANVVGGFSAYERRMIGRLQDRADPNRPAFSSSSVALGAFFYVSSGDINELVRVIRAFLKFFGQGDLAGKGSPFGRPTRPEMKYGPVGVSQGAFKNLGQVSAAEAVPDAVSVTWQMPSGTGGPGQLFSPAPKGFLIHVSTIPDGFNVISLTPKDTNSADVTDLPRVFAAAVDPTTNGALKLYGGVADIGVAADSTDFSSVENASPQAPNLVLQKDQNTPLIKPSLLAVGDIPLVANTYFVKTSFLTRTAPGTKYTATFSRDQLPLAASFIGGSDGFAVIDGSTFEPQTYYFRIRALTEDYITKLDLNASLTNPVSVYGNTDVRPFRFSPEKLREARNGVLIPEPPGNDGDNGSDLTPMSFTGASSPGVAEFPSATQKSYIQAVQAAIALAVLCRADLTEAAVDEDSTPIFSRNVYNPGYGTGLEGAGRDLMARYGISPIWFKGNRPQQFRLKMRWLMARIASDLQSRGAPPDSLAAAVVAEAQPLLDFTWRDLDNDYPRLTILESFDANRVATVEGRGLIPIGTREYTIEYGEDRGIGSNPFCRSNAKKNLNAIYNSPALAAVRSLQDSVIPDRAPSFLWIVSEGENPADVSLQPTVWVAGEGSADFSPIIYNDNTLRVEYIRNALLDRPTIGGEVLAAAAAVLQLAAAPLARPIGDTQWIAIRLMPQALAPLDDLLERLDRFLQGILDGLEGIIDKIVAYIEAIQARIYQLQALLEQIRALLRALDFFALPSVSGLVIVESGIDGITTGLVTATNKPSDSTSSYGAGIAVVAGGLPSVLLELLALILSGGEG